MKVGGTGSDQTLFFVMLSQSARMAKCVEYRPVAVKPFQGT